MTFVGKLLFHIQLSIGWVFRVRMEKQRFLFYKYFRRRKKWTIYTYRTSKIVCPQHRGSLRRLARSYGPVQREYFRSGYNVRNKTKTRSGVVFFLAEPYEKCTLNYDAALLFCAKQMPNLCKTVTARQPLACGHMRLRFDCQQMETPRHGDAMQRKESQIDVRAGPAGAVGNLLVVVFFFSYVFLTKQKQNLSTFRNVVTPHEQYGCYRHLGETVVGN